MTGQAKVEFVIYWVLRAHNINSQSTVPPLRSSLSQSKFVFFFLRYVHLDPLWADFQGTPSTGSRPIPFVDALPASLWLYKQPEENQAPNSKATSLKQPPPLPKRSKAPVGPSRQTSKTGKNILFCQMVFFACFFVNMHFHSQLVAKLTFSSRPSSY